MYIPSVIALGKDWTLNNLSLIDKCSSPIPDIIGSPTISAALLLF